MKIWLKALILVLIIALLGTAYYFILKYEPQTEEEEPLDAISIFSATIGEVEKMEIENARGTYAFVKKGDAWAVEGREFIELNTSKVEAVISSLTEVSALKLIEEDATDLSKYGLKTPQSRLTIYLENGITDTFFLGNLAPDSSSYYFKEAANDNVYTVYNARGNYMLNSLTNYRPLEITSFDTTDVQYMKIENEGKVFEVKYDPPEDEENLDSGALWRILEPFKKKADNDYLSNLIFTPASALTADDIVADNPQNMVEYGFGKIQVSITTSSGTETFKVGRKDGDAFIFVEGRTPVYKIGADMVSFVDVDAMDVAEKFAAIYNINRVNSVVIKSDVQSATLLMKHGDNEEDDEYLIDNTQIDESPFKSVYQKVIGLTIDGVATGSVNKSNIICTIEYKMTDGSINRLEFYPYDDMNVAVNDGVNDIFYMKTKKLQEMYDALSKIKADPENRVD